MNDDQLAEYLMIPVEAVAQITPKQRAVYERMADVEFEIKLWQEGVGPKPEGVIICGPREIKAGS